jgi:hypothetical protein
MTPVEVRQRLLDALHLDLVGPDPGSPLAEEVLAESPSRFYLTGYLVPLESAAEERSDDTDESDLGECTEAGGDDDSPPEPAAARRAFLPSSIGLSVLVPSAATHLTASVSWGDYRAEYRPAPATPGDQPTGEDVNDEELEHAGVQLSLPSQGGKSPAPSASGGASLARKRFTSTSPSPPLTPSPSPSPAAVGLSSS